MSVLQSKRETSVFEVFHNLNVLRKDITDLLLRDFGYSAAKADKQFIHKHGGRDYEQLNYDEKARFMEMRNNAEAFHEWFILSERNAIVALLRDITKEVYIANSIHPVWRAELIQRRLHQDEAIGKCFDLAQELQYAIETLPVDVNIYFRHSKALETEIHLIKGWRKSDNKIKVRDDLCTSCPLLISRMSTATATPTPTTLPT